MTLAGIPGALGRKSEEVELAAEGANCPAVFNERPEQVQARAPLWWSRWAVDRFRECLHAQERRRRPSAAFPFIRAAGRVVFRFLVRLRGAESNALQEQWIFREDARDRTALGAALRRTRRPIP